MTTVNNIVNRIYSKMPKKIGKEKKVRLVICVPAEVSKELRKIANKLCAGNLSYLSTHILEEWLANGAQLH